MINYGTLESLIHELELEEVSCRDFYRTIFPRGSLQRKGVQGDCMYNAMARAITAKGDGTYLNIHDDLRLLDSIKTNRATMNCVSYVGRIPALDNARNLYAIYVRINFEAIQSVSALENALFFYFRDGMLSQKKPIKGKNGKVKWEYVSESRTDIPVPYFFVAEGNEYFLCYVLDTPISLFPNHRKKLQVICNRLSELVNIGLNCIPPKPESYLTERTVVGYCCLNEGVCRAFKFPGSHTTTLDELNAFMPKSKHLIIKKPVYGWVPNGNLYDWFWEQVEAEIDSPNLKIGVFTAIAAYAAKNCMTDIDTIRTDLKGLRKRLEGRFPDTEMRQEICDALNRLQFDYYGLKRIPVAELRYMSGVEIPDNKRQYRPQKQFLKERAEERSVKKQVVDWYNNNPGKRQKDCVEALGFAKSTVSKHWPKSKKKNTVMKKTKPVKQRKRVCPQCGSPLTYEDIKTEFFKSSGKFRTQVQKKCSSEECGYSSCYYRYASDACVPSEMELVNALLK